MLELAHRIESRRVAAAALYGLARVALALGDDAAARAYGEESLMLFGALGYFKMAEVAAWLASLPRAERRSPRSPVQHAARAQGVVGNDLAGAGC
jgi:hypothetical protein